MTKEPMISVGVMAAEGTLDFYLVRHFRASRGFRLSPGQYTARLNEGGITLFARGREPIITHDSIRLIPEIPEESQIVLKGVRVGAGFHWQQNQNLPFRGECQIRSLDGRHLEVTNRLPLEAYLSSVVTSEMSAKAPLEFLKTHAVISRSWALVRMMTKRRTASSGSMPIELTDEETILRWTGSEVHQGFDVCAEDHCQRYRGILEEPASNPERAVHETQGEVLTHGDDICDTRYAKCCGGMTDNFSTAWEDRDMPYLRAKPDSENSPSGFRFPLSDEANAWAWITGRPEAFCNIRDPELLDTLLPLSDRQTADFYRWETVYSQEEIRETLARKTGMDLGWIRDLLPLERGASGRIIRLRIVGTERPLTVGKELEVRRVLSPTHLYSSAFVVMTEPGKTGISESFRLVGAGWGHGVGLCQIGAAVMATRGKTYQEILHHYFPGTALRDRYGGVEIR